MTTPVAALTRVETANGLADAGSWNTVAGGLIARVSWLTTPE